jgi:hypothetical protein
MNRYQILIKKPDQYVSVDRQTSRFGECSCIDGCWRMNFCPACLYLPDFIKPLIAWDEIDSVQIVLPNKRSESKETCTTAKIESRAFVANIDFSQISGMQRPSTKELNSLRQSMRFRLQNLMMSAYGDFS